MKNKIPLMMNNETSIFIVINILSLIIGYFLGTVNPAYLFGKLKHFDIRKKGTLNAGTMNAFHTLGLLYTIPVAVFDTFKGLLAMFLAQIMGADFIIIQLSGFTAILGHVFPFYISFRGGQGVACSTGIMLFYLLRYFILNSIMFYIFGFLLIVALIFAYISKTGEIVGTIVLPFLGYSIFINYPNNPYNVFFCIILIHIVSINIYNIILNKKIQIKDESFKRHWWRVALRPFALLFVLFYIYYPKNETLVFIGSVALFFITIDITRFMHRQTNEVLTVKIKHIFRKNESKSFSSMTIFLVAYFISILLFERKIAITALIFLIFGDIFSKIFGLSFGRHKIFNKTLEGTLAYIGCVILCGYVLFTTLHISLFLIISGGISAPLTELISIKVNDNFSVPLISGSVMEVVKIIWI